MVDKTEQNKFILDACCGPKCFWFNKQHPNTIYIDKRKEEKGFLAFRPNREINPDKIMDHKSLEFPDKSFKLVVFDPPHLLGKQGNKDATNASYGVYSRDTWKVDLKKGFDECWRVLEDYGVLIFKWSEVSLKHKEVLEVLEREPLFGHPVRNKNNTHWFCFMKIPKHSNNKPKKSGGEE